jgi:hypothetical protein
MNLVNQLTKKIEEHRLSDTEDHGVGNESTNIISDEDVDPLPIQYTQPPIHFTQLPSTLFTKPPPMDYMEQPMDYTYNPT